MKEYDYPFKKSRSEVTKDILRWLMVAGFIAVAATSPYFIQNILRGQDKLKKYHKRKIYDAFTYFKKHGLISIEKHNKQIYISLTNRGKKKAGMFQIDNLQIQQPSQWDHKWRVLIFDVQEMKKAHREALRGKLKQLGFFLLQKSVWVHPFDCRSEIKLLQEFFNLSSQEMCLIIADYIEHDQRVKKFFKIT